MANAAKQSTDRRESSAAHVSEAVCSSSVRTAKRRAEAGESAWRWFDRRNRSHAYLQDLAEELDAASARRRVADQLACSDPTHPRVAYVHIPFCDEICTFCAFFRQVSQNDRVVESYVEALCRQIDDFAETTWVRARPFDAIYVGGGTPTVLSATQMTRLLSRLKQWPTTDDCEVTVESRCRRISRDYLRALVEAGVNRLSVGVQSFDTDVRRGTRRLADRAEVLAKLDEARSAGLTNLSIDLIYNLPDQTDETWAASLATLEHVPVTGCSIYALIAQPKSVLGRQLADKQLALGDLSAEYAYHRAAHDYFDRRDGWQRFSSVHFGDAKVETHRYNRVRGTSVDILGLGAGAAWRIGPVTCMNLPAVGPFIESQRDGQFAPVFVSRTSPNVQALADVFALIDGPGIPRRRLNECLPGWRADLDALIEIGLIACDADWCTLTRDGCFWAYTIGDLLGEAIADQARSLESCAN